MSKTPKATIQYISEDFDISEIENESWKKAQNIKTTHYWSGNKAPEERRFMTKFLWSDNALYVRFVANQDEPIIVNNTPNLESKTDKLWEKDVCEIFIAPDKDDFRKYFEFEVSPNGEWLDLGIHQMQDKRETDFDYDSGMKTAAFIKKNKVIMAFKIEWKAFGKTPGAGDIWLGNILRAVGKTPNRGYLAWSPTNTKEPNFHVPENFGEYEFVK